MSLLEALYPSILTVPDYLIELRLAIEALGERLGQDDDSAMDLALLDTLGQLQRSIDALNRAEAVEAVQPSYQENFQDFLEEMRAFVRKGMKPPSIAGVSVGFPDDFKNQLLAIMGGQGQTRLDFDVRTDTQPVYIGRHPEEGVGTDDARWLIEKVTYDTSARPIHKQVLTGTWDNRAGLAW